jgi:1,4-alpha-glucan branching enzyme
VVNFTPVPRQRYRVGLPFGGTWREALNSDAAAYAGSGITNPEPVQAETLPWDGQPFSVEIALPPLAGLVLLPA